MSVCPKVRPLDSLSVCQKLPSQERPNWTQLDYRHLYAYDMSGVDHLIREGNGEERKIERQGIIVCRVGNFPATFNVFIIMIGL